MSDSPPPKNSLATPNLQAALLDYYRWPGKYQLTLREPAILFTFVREVLQIAAGRAPAGVPTGTSAAREAATFFIRAALLYPGADHYAVLGLRPRSEPTDLKERYRLLMRLIHPDFADAGSPMWPADAAVRVNRAYEVLSSPVLRRDYDEQLARGPTQRPAPKRPALRVGGSRSLRAPAWAGRRLAWALGLCTALLAGTAFLNRHEPVQLVQRPNEPLRAAPAATTPKVLDEVSAAVAEPNQRPQSAAPAEPRLPRSPPSPPPARSGPAPVRQVLADPRPVVRPAVLRAVDGPAAPAPSRVWPQPSVQQVAAARDVAPPAEVPLPASTRTETPPAAPAPREPAAATVHAAVSQRTAPPLAVHSPTLNEVQPLLGQLLERMESGSGEQLLRLLHPDARSAASAQALQRQYDLIVRGARPVRLVQVDFISEARGSALVVTSRVRLHAGQPTIGAHGERFAVRAEFAARDGKVVMTSLTGVGD